MTNVRLVEQRTSINIVWKTLIFVNIVGKKCKNANSLRNHERLCPNNPERNYVSHTIGHVAWNKGKTAQTDERIKQAVENWKNNLTAGKFKPSQQGKPLTDAHKQAISNGMKKAHAEKRAHNIGESRWNNEHSWPETWFIHVLQNEFNMVENVHYKTEMSFGRYSLDFAWPEQRLCIEVDGDQHERFEDYKARDIEKDKLLKENDWQVIRIKWKDCYQNPKQYIELVRNKFTELQLI